MQYFQRSFLTSTRALSFQRKYFFDTSIKVLNTSQFSRYKSTNTQENVVTPPKIVYPIGEVQKPSHYAAIFQEFKMATSRLEALLQTNFQKGVNLRKTGKHNEALKYFDDVIALFSGEKIKNMTDEQKIILAESFYNKADIMRAGSSADQNLALMHLYQALEIVPTHTQAKELIRAIELDNDLPIDDALYQSAQYR